jgi:hypothetical protein
MTQISDSDAKLEEIISRRENETTPPWPRNKWDFTEWEETFDELFAWEARNLDVSNAD